MTVKYAREIKRTECLQNTLWNEYLQREHVITTTGSEELNRSSEQHDKHTARNSEFVAAAVWRWRHGDEEHGKRRQNACNRVKQRQVFRARQELVGAALAPKTLETLAELQGRISAGPRDPSRGVGQQTHASQLGRLHVHSVGALQNQGRALTRCSSCVWITPRLPICSPAPPKIWHEQRHHQSPHDCDVYGGRGGSRRRHRSAGSLRRCWPLSSGRQWKLLGHRLRRARDLAVDRRRSREHGAVHRRCGSSRPRLAKELPGQVAQCAFPARVVAVREIRVRSPHDVRVGRGLRHQIHQTEAGERGDLLIEVWAFTIHCERWTRGSDLMTSGSRSWTCTSYLHQTGRAAHTTSLKRRCWVVPGSNYTHRQNSKSGTAEERGLEPPQRASRFFGPRSDRQMSYAPSSTSDFMTRAGCGTQSRGSWMSSARDRSFCNVEDPAATTCCAHCFQASRQSRPSVMTTG